MMITAGPTFPVTKTGFVLRRNSKLRRWKSSIGAAFSPMQPSNTALSQVARKDALLGSSSDAEGMRVAAEPATDAMEIATRWFEVQWAPIPNCFNGNAFAPGPIDDTGLQAALTSIWTAPRWSGPYIKA
jgi:hypothetical protein